MFNDFVSELVKLKAQRKNYVVIVGQLVVVGLLLLALSSDSAMEAQRRLAASTGLAVDDIFDGMYFARIALAPAYLMILPIFICTIAGDMVAGELHEGCMNLYASRSRGRIQIIVAKILSMFVCAFIFSFLLTLLTLGVGVLFHGWPGMQLVLFPPHVTGVAFELMTGDKAFVLLMATAFYHACSLTALGSVTLFYSTIFSRMTTATVAGITTYFVSYFVQEIPQATSIKPYLLTTVMNGSVFIWLSNIPWQRLTFNVCHLGLYIILFCGLSLTVFSYRDI